MNRIPDGFVLARTTEVFDNDTVPAGLLRAHRVANDVWGRLIVHSGSVGFVFEDDPGSARTVHEGGSLVIPPATLHHVELDGPVEFAVEFYRAPRPEAEEADAHLGVEAVCVVRLGYDESSGELCQASESSRERRDDHGDGRSGEHSQPRCTSVPA